MRSTRSSIQACGPGRRGRNAGEVVARHHRRLCHPPPGSIFLAVAILILVFSPLPQAAPFDQRERVWEELHAREPQVPRCPKWREFVVS